MTPRNKLLALLTDHQTDGLFVGSNIPQRKLENAIAHFPIDPTLEVLALIDCTVMGSCKCGMAVTEHGLVWKNDWTTRTSETFLEWANLLERKRDIKIEKYDILFGKGSRLNMAGSSMKKTAAFHLVIALIDLLGELKEEMENEVQEARSNIAKLAYAGSASHKTLRTLEEDPSEQHERFEQSLVTALALMTVADGNVDEIEIDIVIEFIKEEESISDKTRALSEYESQIEKYSASLSKSQAIFKLQSSRAISDVCKLTDQELIDRLEIMLEGMVDVAGGIENTRTVDMMKRIMSSFV